MTKTTALATRSSSGLPAPADRNLSIAIASADSNVVETGGRHRYLDADRSPQGATREAIRNRLRTIVDALNHRDDDLVTAALDVLFALTKGADDGASKLYAARFRDLPAWAAVQACDRYGKGEGSSTVYAPSGPELYKLAASIVAPLKRERVRIERILTADVPGHASPQPGARDRIVTGFAALASTLEATIEATKAGSKTPQKATAERD